MARTRLNGNHLYITKYTDDSLDLLLNRIIMSCKGTGYLIIDKLNLLIAGSVDGYCITNDDTTLLTLLDKCHGAVTYEDVKKTLTFAKEIGYYDKKLCDEERIFTSRDLQIMHFEASENREEVYILSKYSLLKKDDLKALKLVKKGEKIIKSLKKTCKTAISSLSENSTSISYDETSISYEQKPLSYSHKGKNSKENNIKENKINENKINGECNSNSKSNSNSHNSDGMTEKTMHKALKTFLQYNLIPNDPLTLDVINQCLYDLNKKYGANKVINAAFLVMQIMKTKKEKQEPIDDYRAYINGGITNICERDSSHQENERSSNEETANDDQIKSEAEELERLKEARKKRKAKDKSNVNEDAEEDEEYESLRAQVQQKLKAEKIND